MYLCRGTVNDLALTASHAYHVCGRGHGGCVRICHSSSWSASVTCLKVLVKGMLWLQGYMHHVCTGQTIDHYLQDLRRKMVGTKEDPPDLRLNSFLSYAIRQLSPELRRVIEREVG